MATTAARGETCRRLGVPIRVIFISPAALTFFPRPPDAYLPECEWEGEAMSRLTIAQIGTSDEGGGAASVASALMRGYADRGHRVWHVVGRTRSDDPSVVPLDDDDRWWYRALGYTGAQRGLRRIAARHPNRGFGLASRAVRYATHPAAWRARLKGVEDFEFPATHRLLDRLDAPADIIHAHNLHGGYFDLRALPAISRRAPTILTLHDMWLLTGHCAYSLGCERWRSGCGRCADLALEPAVRRDATSANWLRKRDIYAQSQLRIASPSRWLQQQVAGSMLAPAIRESRVIPNGIDTRVFHPANRAGARAAVGLPPDVPVILLTTGSLGSMWKDDATLHRASARLAAVRPDVVFVSVGRQSAVRTDAGLNTRVIPFQRDPRRLADYYRAADLYWHAARADTHPLSVLESMACATPPIATAVGGIPEQVSSDAGIVVPASGWVEMADESAALLRDDGRRARLGRGAAGRVARCFTIDRQVDAYLEWFAELRPATIGARP
jgi:glycosyltransferase involved in cell wall biosynthesis